MKSRFLFSLFLVVAMGCSSTTLVVNTPAKKTVPPGQAKKATGTQSAKTFAPGQQKKKN